MQARAKKLFIVTAKSRKRVRCAVVVVASVSEVAFFNLRPSCMTHPCACTGKHADRPWPIVRSLITACTWRIKLRHGQDSSILHMFEVSSKPKNAGSGRWRAIPESVTRNGAICSKTFFFGFKTASGSPEYLLPQNLQGSHHSQAGLRYYHPHHSTSNAPEG